MELEWNLGAKNVTTLASLKVDLKSIDCMFTDQAKEIDKLEKATRVIGEPNAADLVDILPDSEINPELDSSIVVINIDEIEVFAVNDQTVDPVEKTLKFSEL